MSDHSKLKALALEVPEGLVAPAAYDDDRSYSKSEVKLLNFLEAATPAAVLALISENDRVKARLCVCRDCGGQGEIYSGHDTYQGHFQPPEPDMDVCGTCGGDGVLGPVEDFETLAAERDQLKAENDAIRAAYMAAGEREHGLRVERETLRKAVNYAIEMFSRITSGDGSGHADLGRAVLRIAGTAMGNGEKS